MKYCNIYIYILLVGFCTFLSSCITKDVQPPIEVSTIVEEIVEEEIEEEEIVEEEIEEEEIVEEEIEEEEIVEEEIEEEIVITDTPTPKKNIIPQKSILESTEIVDFKSEPKDTIMVFSLVEELTNLESFKMPIPEVGIEELTFKTKPTTISYTPSNEVKATRFLPTSRRVNRNINKNKFVYKGEFIVGSDISYRTLSTNDSDIMLLVGGVSGEMNRVKITPYLGYSYIDNRSVGIRFGYKNMNGALDAAELDLGSNNDLSFSVPAINYSNKGFYYGVFHRSYAGLDEKGRFGLFAEVELLASMGDSQFSYEVDGDMKSTNSKNFDVDLNFNPGAAVYITPNSCLTLSFGFGGLNYSSITQRDDTGAIVGNREDSKLRFSFNITAIKIGISIHLWGR